MPPKSSSRRLDIAYLDRALLLEIFNIVALSDPPGRKFRLLYEEHMATQRYYFHLGWVRLGHVCRNWRIVLYEKAPHLWGNIVCAFPLAVDTIFERARGSVLQFRIPFLGDDREEEMKYQMRLASTNIIRLEVLEAPHDVSLDWSCVLGGRLLPLLHHLQITHDGSRVKHDGTGTVRSLQINAPSLRHASLWNAFSKFNAPGLRYLSLSGSNFIPSPCWELFDVLRTLPLLETLNLQLLLTPAHAHSGWITYPKSPVHLKRMKSLDVEANAFCDLPQFLLRVILPLKMRFTLESWGGMDIHNRVINTIRPRLTHATHDGLFLNHFLMSGESLRLVVFARAENSDPLTVPEGVCLDLHFGTNGPIDLFNQLREVIFRLDASRITQLIFSAVEALESDIGLLRILLTPFKAVMSVQVHSSTNGLLAALGSVDLYSLGSVLPALQELLIEMEEEAQANGPQYEMWWAHLNAMLQQRAAVGAAVIKLRLVGFWLAEEIKAALQHIDAAGMVIARTAVWEMYDERLIDDPGLDASFGI